MSEVSATPSDQMRYDEARQFLLVQGLVARQLPTHVLAPRPKRRSRAAAFDELAGNTTLGVHLSEIAAGGDKNGHRHLDEAVIYIVTGHGWSELRQDDGKPMQHIEWKAGDLLSIPANAWHQHFNHSQEETSRQLAFKNTRLLRLLFGSREFVYANDFRFDDRYADEDDYWTSRRAADDGSVIVNILEDLPSQELAPAPELGEGVSRQRYVMGGHRMLDVELVEIAGGAHVRPARRLAEQGLYVLSGAGTTQVWNDDGVDEVIEWTAGDLVCPPFNAWSQHTAIGGPARFLAVTNTFLEVALKSARLPQRFPLTRD